MVLYAACLICIHYLVVGRKRRASPTACSTPGEALPTKSKHVSPQFHDQCAEGKDGCLPQSLSKCSLHLAMLFAVKQIWHFISENQPGLWSTQELPWSTHGIH